MGARVIAVETNQERLKLAREFGAAHALTPDEFQAQLKDLTKGEGVDLAMDTTGASAARLAAVRSAKTWGIVCFVGEGGDVTDQRQPRHAAQAADHHRLVDLQRDGSAGVRPLRRR